MRARLYQKWVPGQGAAFSLVELLIVMAIISLLAAMLMPALPRRWKAPGALYA